MPNEPPVCSARPRCVATLCVVLAPHCAQAFKAQFNGKAAAIQGSGWGWLGYNVAKDRVEIATTPNQDPCTLTGLVPLLGIDMWEHAYYLVVSGPLWLYALLGCARLHWGLDLLDLTPVGHM